MAVEIAKESADMFPPLKAVTVALSVLMANYDVNPPRCPILLSTKSSLQQARANTEQVKDIDERVQSLYEVLSSPVGDQDFEEKARRESLRMSVYSLQGTPTHTNPIDYIQEAS